MTTLEAVIGTLIFLVLFMAISDLVVLSNRYSVLSDTGKELARTMSVQGGALHYKPAGYTANYYTIDDLLNMTVSNMRAAGFKDNEWAVGIVYDNKYETYSKDDGTTPVGNATVQADAVPDQEQVIMAYDATQKKQITIADPGTDNHTLEGDKYIQVDYLKNFTIWIEAKYDWPFLSTIFPARVSYLKVTMPGTSEWKYNYDKWASENG